MPEVVGSFHCTNCENWNVKVVVIVIGDPEMVLDGRTQIILYSFTKLDEHLLVRHCFITRM